MTSPVPAGPVTVRLRGHLGDLQPALRRIAEVVLADPSGAGAMTIGDLARAAGCSEATVVRLTHELGYQGYRDFRFRLAEETAVARERSGRTVYEGDIDPADDLAAVVGKIATADARAVGNTARVLDLEVLGAVADHVLGARRIAVFGVGASGLAATDLQQKLARIGLLCTAHVDSHDALPTAALLGEGDVAIGLSHTGRTVDVVDALRIARERGSVTVAITNSPASPVIEEADAVLLTAAHESAFRSGATASRIAQLTVIDCVFVAVARQLPDLGREALRRTRASVEDRRLG
ncbi:MurR/RpiR family transcriptional regulator [Brachybacterium huguangmaarense]|uniref:MurR/RpiR family transcriptional regulator n=1 Tax=Brachybacterium huguangmaarense TaxID=1652028 RepID=A0ABY6G4J2_9MICO|nr:MurR/RpiR family transcriptional regulator [Brachybacterium huguangmaarense]UYG18032.1 MurR/RpiR family transcriptional regulator [Brachybacterium huguangmaarense]